MNYKDGRRKKLEQKSPYNENKRKRTKKGKRSTKKKSD